MIDANMLVRITCGVGQFVSAANQVIQSLNEMAKIFEDRDKWHATTEGEWPDKFTLLNRFVRTGVRPPYIFND